jgi:glycosyltransferase involved in cell wall biosynthesis
MHLGLDLRILDRQGAEHTGLGRYALEIARAIHAARPDWRISAFCDRRDLLPGDATLNVEPTRWPTASSVGRIAWVHAGSLTQAARSRPDVWFGPTYLVPIWWRGPSVVMVQDLVFLLLRSHYRGLANSLHASWATRRAVRRSQRVLCPSAETAAAVSARLDVPAGRIRVVPNGVTEIFFARSEHTATSRDPFLLFVGTFEARKGLDTLAGAFERLDPKLTGGLRLVLAGRRGWGADDHIAALRAHADVEIVESPNDVELATLYRSADALLFPSRMEGFGLPVAEAMAAGTPVVATDLPCIREFAGDAPLYVEAGDSAPLARAIELLLGDERLQAEKREAGLTAAARLRWSTIGERTAAVIEEAAAEQGQRT